MYYSLLKAHIKGGKNSAKLDHNPSLSARNRETTKVDSRFFYIRRKLAYQQVEKENQNKHRQVFADFLQRIPDQGWASEAKPIPTPTKEENKSEQTQQNYSYHLSHFTSKNIQLWKKKNSKTSNSCFATAKALSIKSH